MVTGHTLTEVKEIDICIYTRIYYICMVIDIDKRRLNYSFGISCKPNRYPCVNGRYSAGCINYILHPLMYSPSRLVMVSKNIPNLEISNAAPDKLVIPFFQSSNDI